MNEAKTSKNITLSRQIVLGIWEDSRGRVHVVDSEVMALFRLEDTPRKRQEVRELIEEVARQMGIKLEP